MVQCALLGALLGSAACTGETAAGPPPAVAPPPSQQPAGVQPAAVQPTQPEPTQPPPPPPPTIPAPGEAGHVLMPPQVATGAPAASLPPPSGPEPEGGQWVYTSQYGWIWMPYSQQYTYVTPDSGAAYSYAYYPSVGWEWVYAPWILGWGPGPYWGRLGPARFGWYAHPWFHVGIVHRAPYYHGGGFRGGFRGGGGFHGGGHR